MINIPPLRLQAPSVDQWLACSPLDPRFVGSILTEVDGFLRVLKIRSTTSVPCRRFTACKRTLHAWIEMFLLPACQMALAVTSGLSWTCAVSGLVTHYFNLRKEAPMLHVGATGTNNNNNTIESYVGMDAYLHAFLNSGRQKIFLNRYWPMLYGVVLEIKHLT
jgi:hypothetical protein